MLFEEVIPDHTCHRETLRATTRLDPDELHSVLTQMGPIEAVSEPRSVRPLDIRIGARA